MTITFISVWHLSIVLTVLAMAAIVYFAAVRPKIKDDPNFDQMRGNIRAWLKVRWDMTAAFFVAMIPILWNGALDLTVAIWMVAEQVIPAMAGMDLSGLILAPETKAYITMAAGLIPPLRAAFNAVRASHTA